MKIFFDVETTGFDYLRNDIISCSMIKTDDSLNIREKLYETARPEFNEFYSTNAEEIHGFNKREMRKFQSQESFVDKIIKFFGQELYNLVSHTNNNFDYRMLLGSFLKVGKPHKLQYALIKNESTIKLGRNAGYKKNSLDLWADRINFTLDHHNAESDTLCCYNVYKYLTKDLML